MADGDGETTSRLNTLQYTRVEPRQTQHRYASCWQRAGERMTPVRGLREKAVAMLCSTHLKVFPEVGAWGLCCPIDRDTCGGELLDKIASAACWTIQSTQLALEEARKYRCFNFALEFEGTHRYI